MPTKVKEAMRQRVMLGVLAGKLNPAIAKAMGYDIPIVEDPSQAVEAKMMQQEMELKRTESEQKMAVEREKAKIGQQMAETDLQSHRQRAQIDMQKGIFDALLKRSQPSEGGDAQPSNT